MFLCFHLSVETQRKILFFRREIEVLLSVYTYIGTIKLSITFATSDEVMQVSIYADNLKTFTVQMTNYLKQWKNKFLLQWKSILFLYKLILLALCSGSSRVSYRVKFAEEGS